LIVLKNDFIFSSAYEKPGFKLLDKPAGDTGHYSCSIWMQQRKGTAP